jgi:hypothetical protein
MSSTGKAPPHVPYVPPYLPIVGTAALMIILGFTGWFVVTLLGMGYDLPTAFCAAAGAGVVAGEIAYRLLGRAFLPFGRGGPQPPYAA